MRILDRVDPLNLDQRQRQLGLLALAIILALAAGMTLLIYPTAFSNDLVVSSVTKRGLFFGFCALSVPLVGYLLVRQVVINQFRQRVAEEHQQAVGSRHAASVELPTTLPGFDFFRDRLVLEYRRAARTHLPLSLLLVPLTFSPQLPNKDEIAAAFRDAANSLTRKLRWKDSLYHFPPGVFAIVLPGVRTEIASRISTRLMEALHEASRASTPFLFDMHLINYPEHARTAWEMEEAARSFFPAECLAAQEVEAA